MWTLNSVGRGLLRGVAWGLAGQTIPWLRWWIDAPDHPSLHAQWHECSYAFVVVTLAMITREMLRIRKHGMSPEGA